MNKLVISEVYRQHAEQTFLQNQDSEAFWQACARPLRPSIRVNSLRTSVHEFLQRAEDYGWSLTPIPWCRTGFWLDLSKSKVPFSPGHAPEHLLGEFYIQESSSMIPPEMLGINQPSDDCWVMDMAAAPGSKTTQLAALMENKGLLLANELAASRLKSLHGNLLRMGVRNCYLSHWDASKLGHFLAECFDYILLDAPCSGEGTVRKDDRALSRWQLDQVCVMAQLQKTLLKSAWQALKPGGRLAYSTCTLSYEENQQVVADLLRQTDARVVPLSGAFSGCEQALTGEGYLHVLPHLFDSEGFFVALIEKPATANPSAARQRLIDEAKNRLLQQQNSSRHKKGRSTRKQSFGAAKKFAKNESNTSEKNKVPQELSADESRMLSAAGQHFGFDFDRLEGRFYRKENGIWFVSREADDLKLLVKLNRLGLFVAEIKGKKLRLSHEFAVLMGGGFRRQKVVLSLDELRQWLAGSNLTLTDQATCKPLDEGEVLVCYRQQPVGLGLFRQGQIKNNMARHLLMDKVHF